MEQNCDPHFEAQITEIMKKVMQRYWLSIEARLNRNMMKDSNFHDRLNF